MKGASPSRSGWTLVEILVAASIVSILMAILLPCALGLRRRAWQVSCATRLRQMGMALQMYREEFGDLLPHEDGGDTRPPHGCGWYQVLPRYAGDPRIMQCPLHPTGEPGFSLKMNGLLSQGGAVFLPYARLSRPSQTVLLFDGRTDNPGVRSLPKGDWDSASDRHGGATNLLFCDGHVAAFRARADAAGWDGPGPFEWEPD